MMLDVAEGTHGSEQYFLVPRSQKALIQLGAFKS